MKSIRVVVADSDAEYLRQLSRYVLQADFNLELYSFVKVESLQHFLLDNESGKPDILAVSEEMRSDCVDAVPCIKILLSDGAVSETCGDYVCVEKYQKLSGVVNEMLIAYGRASGVAVKASGQTRKTKIVGVYSPVGGSGKSTIAVMLAYQLGLRQKKVFFQNYERIGSMQELLSSEAKIGLSDIMVAVHGKETGIGLLLQSKMYTSAEWHFSYINPPDSALDLDELNGDEQCSILEEMAAVGIFDSVVVDFPSEFSAVTLKLLQLCDWIIVPLLADGIGVGKVKRMFDELRLHEELAGLKDRMIFIGNKMTPQSRDYLQRTSLYEECVPKAMLPLSESYANVAAAVQHGKPLGGELGGVVDLLL